MDTTDRLKAEEILRSNGVTPEAIAAKRSIDARLEGLGLSPSRGSPTKIMPGKAAAFGPVTALHQPSLEDRVAQLLRRSLNVAGEGAAVTQILLTDGRGAEPPRVIPSEDIPLDVGSATWEPTDLLAAQAVSSLGSTATGGTEVKFNHEGIVYIGSGAMGVYWSRALGASINSKWAPLLAGMRLSYHPQSALFFGTNTVGSVAASGVLTLAFYKMPDHYKKKSKTASWKAWHKQVGEWTEGSGDSSATGVLAQLLGTGATNGTDVTLGTFSDAGAGTQIFKAGTNFPVGGASRAGAVILNASNANTDAVWVAETALLAVASNNGIFQAGQDIQNRALGEKLFMLANSGTQVIGARYRS